MKMRADEVKRALEKKHREEVFLTEVKTGPTHYALPGQLQKLDALAIKKSWANPCFTAYEVKVSRSDFLQDDKWPNYLNYCHRFYFACPNGLIKPEELSDEVGLVWVNPEGGWSVRKAALFRKIEIPWEMLYYIVISRLGDHERHPFFSNTRELYEAFVQDKAERYQLAHRFSQKFADMLQEADRKVAEAERKVAMVEGVLRAAEMLKAHGIDITASTYSIDWELQKLEERLKTSVPPRVLNDLAQLEGIAHRVRKALLPPEEDEGDGAA